MSGAVAKVTRRNLRRAVGEEAVNIIETQMQQIATLARQVRTITLQVDGLLTAQAEAARAHKEFVEASRVERFRWLVM